MANPLDDTYQTTGMSRSGYSYSGWDSQAPTGADGDEEPERRSPTEIYKELHVALPRRIQAEEEGEKHRGTIRWYNPDKGVGFVAPVIPGPNLFLHSTALASDYKLPEPGDSVTYGIAEVPPNEKALAAHERYGAAASVGHAIGVSRVGRVSFGDDGASVAWTNISGLTNPWAKGSRPPQRTAPTPPTWKMYFEEEEDDYVPPEPDIYEITRLHAEIDDEWDGMEGRPASPIFTRPSTYTTFAEMETAMAGISFNPDPSEIQLGGGDSPRLLSMTEEQQVSMMKARERARKPEGAKGSASRTLVISHTGHEGGRGAKKPKNKGIVSLSAPRKFASTGRVHKKSHGYYLNKEQEFPVEKPKGRHPFKKELADVSFELEPKPKQKATAGVHRKPKPAPRVPRVVAVAHPILSAALRRPDKFPSRAAVLAADQSVEEPEPEPELSPEEAKAAQLAAIQARIKARIEAQERATLPEPEPALGVQEQWRVGDGEPEPQQPQPEEEVEEGRQLLEASGGTGLAEQYEKDLAVEPASTAAAEQEGAAVLGSPMAATPSQLRRAVSGGSGVAATAPPPPKPGALDRSSRVRFAPGARPQRPHEQQWARNPAKGEWYLAGEDNSTPAAAARSGGREWVGASTSMYEFPAGLDTSTAGLISVGSARSGRSGRSGGGRRRGEGGRARRQRRSLQAL